MEGALYCSALLFGTKSTLHDWSTDYGLNELELAKPRLGRGLSTLAHELRLLD